MKVCVLGSGRGSNCQAILQASLNKQLGLAQIVGVFSDVKEAGILQVAKSYGIENQFLDPGNSRSKIDEKNEADWIEILLGLQPDLIVLAGFMRIVSTSFIHAFDGRIINIHPSILPSFKGRKAIEQAWDHKVKISGCTVHWVSEGVDSGAIIAQAPVRIMNGDSLAKLTQKIQAAEHMLLPWVISDLSTGAIHFMQ